MSATLKLISDRAQQVLSCYNLPNITLVNYWENTSHDGHDEFGPLSNQYDFYVVYEKNGQKNIDHWHAEQWYLPNEKVEYHLASSTTEN